MAEALGYSNTRKALADHVDYVGCKEFNTLAKQELQDYQISVDMAKQICMIQRSPEGKQIRQYFIDLEKAWNTPEQIMARALKVADKRIELLKQSASGQGRNRKNRNMIKINYISWFSGGIATDLPPLQTYNTRMCKAVKSELLKNT